MPQAKLVAETVQTVEVKLQPNTRRMVVQRCVEHAGLARQKKEIDRRQKAIRTEVDALFAKDKQGKALLDGTTIDGHKLKMVIGKRKVFDQAGFMKKHAITTEDFAEFTTEDDNEPYVKITAPGEKEGER